MKSEKLVVIFAGGGTGGHLYPAIAVARELQKRRPQVEIHFVGSSHGLETKIIPKEGFPLHVLSVGGLIRAGRIHQLKTLLLMPFVFLKCIYLCLKLRPNIVLGVGGFAAGPFVLVSSFLVRQTYYWEPNAHPGFTNRILSRFVRKGFVVFEEAKKKLRSTEMLTVGLPIRNSIEYRPREAPYQSRDISNTSRDKREESDKVLRPFRIFVFGGSQGARAINNAVSQAVRLGGSWLEGVEIVHQTGKQDFERMLASYDMTPSANSSHDKIASSATDKSKNSQMNHYPVKVLEFIDDMSKYYSWADLVICRGGVGTISELIATRKAAIVIPLPTAAENHQQSNAEVLVNAQAGEMLLQKDLTPENLIKHIVDFKNNPQRILEFETNIQKLQRPSGSAAIVSEMLKDFGT